MEHLPLISTNYPDPRAYLPVEPHAAAAVAAAVVAVVVVVADAVVVVVRVPERPGRHAVAGAASVVLVVVLQLVQECSYVGLLFKFSQH